MNTLNYEEIEENVRNLWYSCSGENQKVKRSKSSLTDSHKESGGLCMILLE